MNVCFFSDSGAATEPLRGAIRELFPNAAELRPENSSATMERLSKADLILLEMTGPNTAAYYLLGVADSLAKRSILLSGNRESITPGFVNRAAIIHSWNIAYLKAELAIFSAQIAPSTNENPTTPTERFNHLFGDLLVQHNYIHRGPVEFEKEVFTLHEQNMDLPLVQEIAKRAKSLNLRVRLL